MTQPSLQKAAAISFAAHIVFFIVATLIGKASFMRHDSKTYIIDLVTPSASQTEKAESPAAGQPIEQPKAEKTRTEPQQKQPVPPQKKETAKTKAQKQPDAKEAKMAMKSTKELDDAAKRKDDYIKSLKQKQVAEDRGKEAVSDLATKSALDKIRASASAKGKDTGYTNAQIEGIQNAYASKIQNMIERNWIYPDTGVQYVECSVAITVRADGSLVVNKIVQPSGNRTFDQSTLKAIKKTATVEPPPFGESLDVVLKFIPKK